MNMTLGETKVQSRLKIPGVGSQGNESEPTDSIYYKE